MRRFVGWLIVLALVLSVAGVAGAAPGNAGQSHRVMLAAGDAGRARVAIRNAFGSKVTADLNDAQLAVLDRMGIAYEAVPLRTVSAGPPLVTAKAKPSPVDGTRLATPATQVPYGIKMIYGNAGLTPAGISSGSGVTVAVLDTGSVKHSDFFRPDGTFIIAGCVDFSQKTALVEGTCTDGNGHGTHVTGTIAATGGRDGLGVYGVAPGANIFSYKVLNDQGSGYADDIANGIRTAADRGANIISMSLGGTTISTLELDAVQYAAGKGVLVVAAAGNSGPNPDTIGYPGGFKEVVAVAALNPDEVVSYFSSRGLTDGNDATIVEREVEVAGPGRNTLSTYKDGKYYVMSGTSMATPHIAGLAAKMWQGSGATTRTWLVNAAKQHDITIAEQINNAGPGYDIAAGYGLPQVNTLFQTLWSD